jgi:hypothetical protein
MHRLLSVALIPLLAALIPCQTTTAQPAGYTPPNAPSPTAPPYARGAGLREGSQAYNSENCGTPDEPKPCPPLPRHPLQTYPGYRPSRYIGQDAEVTRFVVLRTFVDANQ